MPEVYKDFGSSMATAAMPRTASVIPDISTTSTAAEAPVASRMSSNILGPDLGPIATAVVSETVAAMVESATTTAVATEQRARHRLALPENEPTTSLLPTSVASAPPPTRESSAEHLASSTELSSHPNSSDKASATGEDQDVPEPVESKTPPVLQQPRKASASVAKVVAKCAPTITSGESRGEGEPLVILQESGHSDDEAEKSDETKRTMEANDRERIEGSTRGSDEAVDGKAEKQAPLHEEEKGESPEASEVDAAKTEDDEQLARPEQGAGRMVHSSGPEDGTTVWVDGRREDAVVKVIRFSPAIRSRGAAITARRIVLTATLRTPSLQRNVRFPFS